jgi:hypothetical protein
VTRDGPPQANPPQILNNFLQLIAG